jgi:hypothetical protein
MSPAEILGLRATADKPASREIRSLVAVAGTVAAALMPIAAVAAAVVPIAAVAAEVVGKAAVGIAAAEKRADEELQ